MSLTRIDYQHAPFFFQPMPAAEMISFDAFGQFHPTMAPQCNINNYP